MPRIEIILFSAYGAILIIHSMLMLYAVYVCGKTMERLNILEGSKP